MIAVIIPVYNSDRYLERCLDSILGQTYGDLEIILIDDGSTDRSGEICDRYAADDSRVKVLHQKNMGVSGARNAGLAVAQGEYVSFIDSDDWIDSQYFELLYNVLKDGRYDVSMCHYRKVWNEDFRPDRPEISMTGVQEITNHRLYEMLLAVPIDKYRLSPLPYDTLWGKLYRREKLKNLLFKKIWAEDVEFNSRLYMRVDTVAVVPVPLYVWIQYPASLHRQQAYDNLGGFIQENVEIYRNLLPDFPVEKGQALKRVFLSVLASRYFLSHDAAFEPSRHQVEPLIKETVGDLMPDLLKRSDIPVSFKAGILVFYYLPFTYSLFRWASAKYSKFLG